MGFTEGALLVSQKNEVGLADAIFMGADGIKSQGCIDSAAGDAEGSYSSFADLGETDADPLNSFLEHHDTSSASRRARSMPTPTTPMRSSSRRSTRRPS